MAIVVGCAGWSLRKEFFAQFPKSGTHLARYAAQIPGVEINSSFYKSHRRASYERWAMSVPPNFRFAVKLPKQITHLNRLVACEDLLDSFLQEVTGLGNKLGPILIQLPPSFEYESAVVGRFFHTLRSMTAHAVVCEPRHASWFAPAADQCLVANQISRVAADPAVVTAAAIPGGDGRIAYHRFHGSPRMYYSRYDDTFVQELADRLVASDRSADETWCIFDNTAEGAATENALELQRLLQNLAILASDHR